MLGIRGRPDVDLPERACGKVDMMNILLLGSGGREHAICVSLCASPHADKVFVAPGNGGTATIAENVSIDIADGDAVVAFAKAHDVELVVIGPEAPLVAGVADAVRAAGIACFGPGAAGARVEGSKAFSKKLMEDHDIPTAAYGVFEDEADALAYIDAHPGPIVVKADGLAAGKGVTVAADSQEARAAISECFAGRFGQAGATVVVEEMLDGPECSLLAFVSGRDMIPMATAQDHKRAYDDDKGPNTGGMGVYSPVPIVTDEEYEAMVSIMQRTVEALADEGIDYRGCLYGGFMLTDQGPRVLEYNARFGDPETEVVLPRLETDLVEVMMAVAQGRLSQVELEWNPDFAVAVVLASKGYPGSYEKGKLINNLPETEALEGVRVYHAGTALNDKGDLVTSGGRVLAVCALGSDFQTARTLAYTAAALIDFDGKFYRSDIGARVLRGRQDRG